MSVHACYGCDDYFCTNCDEISECSECNVPYCTECMTDSGEHDCAKKSRASDPNTLQEALEDGGYTTRAYSGRGMMGKECLGVDMGRGQNLAIDTHADLIRKAKSDSMGLGVIYYWPNIPYTESKENQDGEQT